MVVLGGCRAKDTSTKEEREKPIPVKVATVQEKELWVSVTGVGTVKPNLTVQIKSKIPAKILRIPVQESAHVHKGELLAELEAVDYHLAVKNAKAALKAAKLSLKEAIIAFQEAQSDWIRYRRLFEKKVIAKQKWDHMNATYQKARVFKELAEARVARAKIALEMASTNLKHTKIYAPFDGIISRRLVDPGDRVYTMPPTVLMILMDTSRVKVVADIPEKELPYLKRGATAEMNFDALPGQTFTGSVTKILPAIDPVTRNFKIEITLPNPEDTFRAGMFVRVKIFVRKIKGLVIPRSALLKIPGTGIFYAFKVVGDSVQKVNLETGIRQDDLVQVTKGLQLGDKVVVLGNARLKTGKKIQIIHGDNTK